MKLEGRTVNVEFEPDRRYVSESKGGIDSQSRRPSRPAKARRS
jgi:hypothetical protein